MEQILHTLGLAMIPLIWLAVITGIISIVRVLRDAPDDCRLLETPPSLTSRTGKTGPGLSQVRTYGLT